MRALLAVMVVAACGNNRGNPTPDALPAVPTPVFTQTAYIKSSTPLHDSHFRASALSGDGRTLVGSYEGVVTVYERNPTWRITTDLTPTTPSPGFGWSIAISRDGLTIAVSARDDRPVGNSYVGAVYVFGKSQAGWVQQARFEDPSNTEVGGTLALSGDGNLLVVLSRDYSTSELHLLTYERTASTWSGAVATDSNQPWAGPLALAPDGSALAAATGANIDVFGRSGNAWVKRATLLAPAQSVYFETTIACAERCETIAVGDMEPQPLPSPEGPGMPGPGVGYVFTGDGATWGPPVTLRADNGDIGDQFGRAIAISDDGLTVVVGAPAEAGEDNTAPYAGAAYVFRHDHEIWSQVLYLTGSNTATIDIFGSRVAVSKDATTIAVSAIYENSGSPGVDGDQSDESQPYAGAAYVFEGTY